MTNIPAIKKYISIKELTGFLLILLLFIAAFVLARNYKTAAIEGESGVFSEYLEIEEFDVSNPLHRILLKETLDKFYSDNPKENEKVFTALEQYNFEQYTNPVYKTGADKGYLTFSKIPGIIWQFIPFVIIFLIVLAITYYGSVSLGTVKFVQYKRGEESALLRLFGFVKNNVRKQNFYKNKNFYTGLFIRIGILIITFFGYIILFSPAYVAAYAIRTEINTDTYFFMIILGIFTNSILINYINRFYTFLFHENKKGYVETAKVKNLNEDYRDAQFFNTKNLSRPVKKFSGHLFGHIYANSVYQFIPGIKDLASFLITGLIIIEMALNIQGHFGYELLKQVLYKNYDVVVFYIFLIFLLVKATELSVDILYNRIRSRYEN